MSHINHEVRTNISYLLTIMAWDNARNYTINGLYEHTSKTIVCILSEQYGSDIAQRTMARFSEIVGGFTLEELEEVQQRVQDEQEQNSLVEYDALDNGESLDYARDRFASQYPDNYGYDDR